MKKAILIAVNLLFFSGVFSQKTLLLRPNGEKGKDAVIDSRQSTKNLGDHHDYPAISWTNGGTHVDGRRLIEFDLSCIKKDQKVISAKLSLYSYYSLSNGSHYPLSGSNASIIQRIIEPWEEHAVSWSNQPAVTTLHQVFLPQSTFSIEDYLDIDVTDMVKDMLDDAADSHGFLLRLVTEQHYRRLIFASSDATDSNLHPKLEIEFEQPIVLDDCDSCEFLAPNVLTLNHDGINEKLVFDCMKPVAELFVFDRWGNQLFSSSNYQHNWPPEPNKIRAGVYYWVLREPSEEEKVGFVTVLR